MGCVYSSRKILPPSVFKVKYINDNGNKKYYGLMEINAYNLILHKKREPRIIWPLNTVKRYGYNDFMFYFEAGRSSPCGQGKFAFISKEAKDIFNEIKGNLHAGNGTNMARDMSSEMGNYSGQSYTSTHTIEKVYDEVNSNGLNCNSESNNNTQPPDLLLDPSTAILPHTSYANTLNDNEEDDDDLFNNPFELPKDIPTYTEVKIALCSPEQKSESIPTSPTEILGYTAIDINQTMHLSQKMFKGNEDAGIRKTHHDYAMSNP